MWLRMGGGEGGWWWEPIAAVVIVLRRRRSHRRRRRTTPWRWSSHCRLLLLTRPSRGRRGSAIRLSSRHRHGPMLLVVATPSRSIVYHTHRLPASHVPLRFASLRCRLLLRSLLLVLERQMLKASRQRLLRHSRPLLLTTLRALLPLTSNPPPLPLRPNLRSRMFPLQPNIQLRFMLTPRKGPLPIRSLQSLQSLLRICIAPSCSLLIPHLGLRHILPTSYTDFMIVG